MGINLFQAALLLLPSYALWLIIRPFVMKSSLANIPGPPSDSWLKGNLGQLFSFQGWEFHRHLAETYGAVCKVHGLFGEEQLYVSDPLALHHIVVKDQYIFEEASSFLDTNKLAFGTSLISTVGEHHRKQRKMLNPVFSPKHMRDLTPIFYPIAHQLREALAVKLADGVEEVDMNSWISHAALEFIGQGGLGCTFDAMDEKKTNRYHDAAKLFMPLASKLTVLRQLLPFAVRIGTPWFRRKVLDVLPLDDVQRLKGVIDTMHDESVAIYNAKKEALAKGGNDALAQQIGKGKDIMSILLKANTATNAEDRLQEEEVIGQMNTFLFAGHDTSTSALSRILHQLSLNQDVQKKVRDEVTEARKAHGELEYDMLMGLPWLDAVCRETLRVYAPVPQLIRTTREDVVLPLKWPIKSADGKSEIREIPLRKTTGIIISIINANTSKEVWGEDAYEWKPERWIGKSPDEVAKTRLPGVYSSMMTFLGGGRACIGFKFSELEIKTVLSVLLEKFVFSPSSKEIYWNLGGLASPTIKGSSQDRPTMPMKLSVVVKD